MAQGATPAAPHGTPAAVSQRTGPTSTAAALPARHEAFPAQIYRARREQLLQRMRASGGGVAVLRTAAEQLRNRDADHAFRHDSYFYYLTGFTEPGAALVLDGRHGVEGAPAHILFCREKNAEREVWEGRRLGPVDAVAALGVDAALPIDALDAQMTELLANAPALYYPVGATPTLDEDAQRWLASVRARGRSGLQAPGTLIDLLPALDDMRVVKDRHEQDLMRRAARISAAAHRRAMRACRPGMREYEIEAELLYEFRRSGAQAPAYGSIVAAGENACVLHYPAGDAIARDGDLVLIDAACELDGYASDITRTFPANGRFSAPQRALYDIVLAAQQAAADATRPGAHFDTPHDAAVRVLVQGMFDTGLLQAGRDGDVEQAIAQRSYSRFYMHRTGHWLGMDVHDCGDYFDRDGNATSAGAAPLSRTLVPGMVLTIEPGLYVRPGPDVPEQYWNIGIRIEDDAIVTADGCELITRDVPVAAAAIEALMREGK